MINSLRRRARDDSGSLSVFVVVLVPALLLLVGLAVDGGNGYRTAQRADAYAAEAARAGAQAVAPGSLLAGKGLHVDPTAAKKAAAAYLTAVGVTGTVAVDVATGTITVDVTVAYPTEFLGLMGISTMTVHGHAAAVLLHGVTKPEP